MGKHHKLNGMNHIKTGIFTYHVIKGSNQYGYHPMASQSIHPEAIIGRPICPEAVISSLTHSKVVISSPHHQKVVIWLLLRSVSCITPPILSWWQLHNQLPLLMPSGQLPFMGFGKDLCHTGQLRTL